MPTEHSLVNFLADDETKEILKKIPKGKMGGFIRVAVKEKYRRMVEEGGGFG